jgi:hypothetical protein
MRYGGNTSCVEVRLDDDTLIIFDAGTGIRALGQALLASPRPGTRVPVLEPCALGSYPGIPFLPPPILLAQSSPSWVPNMDI